mgnify:CR=1 FL=1
MAARGEVARQVPEVDALPAELEDARLEADSGAQGGLLEDHRQGLARAGLVAATRGAEGGYRLARPPAAISAAEIVDALEGPVAITECSTQDSQCELESLCVVSDAWQQINQAILGALEDVSLADLQRPSSGFTGAALNPPSSERRIQQARPRSAN